MAKSQTILELHKSECNGCPRQEDWCVRKHPHMDPVGPTQTPLYILGKHPDKAEDNQGVPLAGVEAKYLRDVIQKLSLPEPRINNTIRCIPGNAKGPQWKEIESCRPSIIRDILLVRPKVVVAMGGHALSWLVDSGAITSWAGKPFVKSIHLSDPDNMLGSWVVWVVGVPDPGVIMRDRSGDAYRDFHRQFKVVQTVLNNYPAPQAKMAETLVMDQTVVPTLEALQTLISSRKWGGLAALDTETTGLKPKTDKLLSLAWTTTVDGIRQTFTVPLYHPENMECGAPGVIEQKLKLLGEFFCQFKGVVFHNATFDLRFLYMAMGDIVLKWNSHDSLAMSYVLDTHAGIHSLDTCALMHLDIDGFKDFSQVDVTNLANEPLFKVLRYNGTDSAATLQLGLVLQKKLEDAGLWSVYQMHRQRLAPLAVIMMQGIPIDNAEAFRQATAAVEEEERIREAIRTDPDVQAWEMAMIPTPTFNPASVPQVKAVMIKAGYLQKGESSDEESVSRIKAPLAKNILGLRSAHRKVKLFTDYVARGDTVYPNLNPAVTRTARLSSNDPNMQNLEKGEPRAIVAAPPGHAILSADYGQLEACVIAAASKDKYFINAIREGLDVHEQCSKELLEIAPPLRRKVITGGQFDKEKFAAFRSDVKNLWTFPAFYLASVKSRSEYMGITMKQAYEYDEIFWNRFEGVKRWQEHVVRRYQTEGIMIGPTGRRYTGIMTPNDLSNWGIQGGASDIVVESQNRCVRNGMIPRLNIHDELLFIVPITDIIPSTERLVTYLLTKPGTDMPVNYFSWLNVPLSITVKVGKNWSKMKTIGKYVSEWKE